MKTTIIKNEDQSTTDICIKKAESEFDKKKLLQIARNINFLNEKFPELGQGVVYIKDEEIAIRATPGKCLYSPEAFVEYPNHQWIIDSIAEKLELIQKELVVGQHGLIQRLNLIKPVVKGLFSGCEFPVGLVVPFISILLGRYRWVYAHGDFTENNFAVDFEKQTVWIIDWEEFGIMPNYFDDFFLIFHHCVPISEMGWQTAFMKKKFSGVIDNLLNKNTHAVAILVLYILYYFETFRSRNPQYVAGTGKFDGKDAFYFKRRAAVRYENLLYLMSLNQWKEWINGLFQ